MAGNVDLPISDTDSINAHVHYVHRGLAPPGVEEFSLRIGTAVGGPTPQQIAQRALMLAQGRSTAQASQSAMDSGPMGTSYQGAVETLPANVPGAAYAPTGTRSTGTPSGEDTRIYVFDPREGWSYETDGEARWVCYHCELEVPTSGAVVQRHLRTAHGILTTSVWKEDWHGEDI